ncbi:cytoplasmic protein [Cryptococcus wingfieldii CBS 7118]|uniref:Cytoplasmic protein n=1 Tax=Cryptococcus wingfieldii CBS 7118 TaxID=1295528 RepID=A0A1E3HLU6_9TREE|nr:cytoplasmic protein [Cryptococcus wingfieldii CBS 7118]ODN77310.1 cytoplasmic protein [Cryptococcus wingfieldii CBS 7118]
MPLTIDFSNKLVLITGGGRGIGLAISTALAQAGADLAITYTSTDASPVADKLSNEYGVTVKAFKCEVTESEEVDRVVGEVGKVFGKEVDIGVANAGVSLWKDAHENTDGNIFAVNTYHPYYLSRALVRSWLHLPIPVSSSSSSSFSSPSKEDLDIPSIKGLNLKKQILFVSSISALVAMNPQRQTAYNASKGAVTMMAKSLAGEWSHLGLRINRHDRLSPDATAASWVSEWEKRTPVGRFASPAEIGEFIAVLLSEKMGGGGFMVGSDVVVDGGYTVF